MSDIQSTVSGPTGYDNGTAGLASGLLAGAALKGGSGDYKWDNGLAVSSMGGICDLRHEVGEVGRWVKASEAEIRADVKDAECSIRHDVKQSEAEVRRDVVKAESEIRVEVLKEGQENLRATKDSECALSKEILETRHTLAKDILRAEYESKLAIQAAIKEINSTVQHNSERTQDKLDHGFEEVTEATSASKDFNAEKFCELQTQLAKCCCELEGLVGPTNAAVSQQGLVNAIVSALNVSSGK